MLLNPEKVGSWTFVHAGNSSHTMITTHFARQLGLVDFDGRPTQAVGRTVRSRGVVLGAYEDCHVINIQYKIKGM